MVTLAEAGERVTAIGERTVMAAVAVLDVSAIDVAVRVTVAPDGRDLGAV